MKEMSEAVARGNTKKFQKMVKMYGLVPSDEQILNEMYRMKLTPDQRKAMESLSEQDIYRIRRQGE